METKPRRSRPAPPCAAARACAGRPGPGLAAVLGEAVGDVHGAERLAGLGRVDGEGVAGKVLLLVVFGLGPLDDLLDGVVGVLELEVRFLGAEHFGVLGLTEQQFVVEDLVG